MRIELLLPLTLALCAQWHSSTASRSSSGVDMVQVDGQRDPRQFFYQLDDHLSSSHSLHKRETDSEEKLRKNKKVTSAALAEKPVADKPLKLKPTNKLLQAGSVGEDVSTPSDLPELDDVLKPPPPNYTNPTLSKDDNHTYYMTSTMTNETYARSLWLPMDQMNSSKRHQTLSNAHRRAATERLSFKFPFYGHEIENITIATGGFLFLGEAIHTWLAATQYIAPLMANFNTSISNSSNIFYFDNGTAFTVQWDRVYLQEGNNQTNLSSAQPFSFQVTLHKNGEIVFVYLKVPTPIDKISEDKHPVKVGISDAYIIERAILFIRRKTIYEYHKTEMKRLPITDFTVVRFRPLATCISIKDCETCVKPNVTSFDCGWCESVGRCSDGYDRHRHSWLSNNCEDQANEQRCPVPGSSDAGKTQSNQGSTSGSSTSLSDKSTAKMGDSSAHGQPRKSGGFGLLSVFFLIVTVSGLTFWSFYAYKNPQSSSGQFLIKYRPTQWKFGPTDA